MAEQPNPVLGENLKRLMDGRSIEAVRLAMAERGLKIGTGSLHRALNGLETNRLETLQKIASFFDVTMDQLLQPALGLYAQLPSARASFGVAEPAPDDDAIIPQYDAGGAMGRGLVLEAQPPGIIRSWSVSPEWLRLNVPYCTSPENLCIVTGFGNSMVGMYNPGDPLICDTGRKQVDVDGVYFFRVDSHGFIKILQRIPTADGVILRAKSKNPDYDPFDITPKIMASEGFEVFGKILRAWKSEAL